MPSMEVLERLRNVGCRPPVEVYEPKPPRELVASQDILRPDALGRTVVAVPAGTVPPHWVKLTAAERQALVPPPEPKPRGYLHPGPFGFTPEGVSVGYTIEQAD
jgi:hypothetical protein